MDWQAVENQTLPSAIYGAMSLGFSCAGRGPIPLVYNRSERETLYQRGDDCGNLPWSTSLMVVAEAYASNSSWAAKFSGQPEILQRVALALDVHMRAQGSNGGFRRGSDSTAVWIGGPHRMPADNPLKGWAHASLARSFLLTRPAMECSGMLK